MRNVGWTGMLWLLWHRPPLYYDLRKVIRRHRACVQGLRRPIGRYNL